MSRFSCNYSRHRVHAGSYEITLAFLVERCNALSPATWIGNWTSSDFASTRGRFRVTRHLRFNGPFFIILVNSGDYLDRAVQFFKFLILSRQVLDRNIRAALIIDSDSVISSFFTRSVLSLSGIIKLLKLNFYESSFHRWSEIRIAP